MQLQLICNIDGTGVHFNLQPKCSNTSTSFIMGLPHISACL